MKMAIDVSPFCPFSSAILFFAPTKTNMTAAKQNRKPHPA
jgi:hypothetical protein